jgi:recombination protein RecT
MTEQKALTPFQQLNTSLTTWAGYARPIYERYFPMEVVVRSAMMAAKANPSLTNCDSMSFITAVLQCAQWGLLPNTPADHAYLVPFGGKIVLIPGYKGLLHIGFRDKVIIGAEVAPVRKDDVWEYERNTDRVWYRHVPKYDSADLTTWEDNDVTHVYSVLFSPIMPNRPSVNVLTIPEIRQIRDEALSRIPAAHQKSAPWIKWPMPQALKSSIKRNIKTIPLGVTDLADAVMVDNKAESGERFIPPVLAAIETEVSADMAAELTEQAGLKEPTKTDKLSDKLNGKDDTGTLGEDGQWA